MKQLIIIVLCVALASLWLALASLWSEPAEVVKSQESLITIEQGWLANTDGHAGKADEMENGRKCWRVEPMDFHGQQVWPAWRCTVLEGPAIGTIQWEWRNPEGER